MKRSQMIELIVYEALSWDGLDTSGVPLEEIANDMLNVCEKFGMLPPTSKIIKSIDAEMPALGKGKFNYEIETNEWESEE